MLNRPLKTFEFIPTQNAAIVIRDGKTHNFVRCLGSGKYGSAYLFSGGVVIKEIHGSNEETKAAAMKEAKFNQALSGNSGYLECKEKQRIMTPYRGVSLNYIESEMRDLFLTGDVRERDIVTIKFFKGLLKAFLELCSEKIIHDDTTPGNIAINQNGKLSFIDFGRAHFYTGSEEKYTTHCQMNAAYLLQDYLKYLDDPFTYTFKYQLTPVTHRLLRQEISINEVLHQMDDWLTSNGCTDFSDNACFANIASAHLAKHGYNPDGEKDNLSTPLLPQENIIPKPFSHTFFKPTKIPLETVLEILIRSIAMLLGPLNPYMWLYLFNDDRPNDENRAHIRKRY